MHTVFAIVISIILPGVVIQRVECKPQDMLKPGADA